MEPSRVRVRVRAEVRPAGVGMLSISGEFDHDGVATFEEAVRSVRAEGCHCLLLDLSGLTFMDSSGVNAMLRVQRDSRARGGWTRLAGPRTPVLKVIELVGLDQAIPLYTTVDDALAA
ncbi:STAS domain-containing protein [Streptomyces ficellus]|uniref:Anti-sigma factor antagonist n=1 Tax=Streptomyces ficellus TaxID=1977088 RepID=A0ABT7Z1F7_9ACTN|nr:STAS domain-containing protein [Streptomyces ficellus]MDN3293328.1 STAS domain-containing protein [Streptomyces ficellus]